MQKDLNASSNALFPHGKAEYRIKKGKSKSNIQVTYITVNGILGLDFLKKGWDIIDLNSNTIILYNFL